MIIMFLHGLESGPFGNKYHWLLDTYEQVESPNFEGIYDVERRVQIAIDAIEQLNEPVLLVGSSFGGLIATLCYERLVAAGSDLISSYVLLAPALHREDLPAPKVVATDAVVIHGRNDEVVPFVSSEKFCANFGLELVAVQDGHPLADSKQQVMAAVAQLAKSQD